MTIMTSVLSPFQLLEINLISAQDLAKVSRNMRTYAMAWVHPERKLTTRVDTNGGTNPTWNDKFIFRVDDDFLCSDMAAVMIEIYALHWFRDVHVGTVRVLLSNLIPPQTRSHHPQNLGMRFVALQVRRRSGRPQGILNVGVTVLDSTMRSMPLYTQLDTSALGYQQLMGTEDLHHNASSAVATSARLRRTKSERSSMLGVDEQLSEMPKSAINGGSTRKGGGSTIKGGSTVNGSEINAVKKGGKMTCDKPLSVIDGASDLAVQLDIINTARAMSTISHSSVGTTTRGKGKNKGVAASSIASQSDVGMVAQTRKHGQNYNKKGSSDIGVGSQFSKSKHNWLPPPPAGKGGANSNKPQLGPYKGYPKPKDFANGSVWSESEVGPSPSEVAAAIAEDSKYRQLDDTRSSLLYDKWSMDDGSEGLRTKLDRWRTQLPTLYDYSSYTSTAFAPKHARRHTEAGGKFSCFGNIAGYECSIVCGKSAPKKRAANKRLARAPSLESMSTYL
ncbi:hypothetical protein Ancab_013630 [Ancistrocladus abbreviatus]